MEVMSNSYDSLRPLGMPKMQYCSKCTYPIVAVNLRIGKNGLCSGCFVHEAKYLMDWNARELELKNILDGYKSIDRSNYDCIIAVGGGKDSHFQTWYVKEKLGLNPLLVTYYTHNYSQVAEDNLRNMSRRFNVDHYIFTPGYETVKKLNIAGFKSMGDMSWHFHCGAWTVPFKVAFKFKIPIVLYGEHGFMDLAGQYNFNDRPEFTVRHRLEHVLRGVDWEYFVDKEGLTKEDLLWAKYPSDEEISEIGIRGIFMGIYTHWDANEHGQLMIDKFGFKPSPEPYERTYRLMSNVDDIHENGIKDWLKFVKFGYGRATDHTSKDIRLNMMSRDNGIELVKKHDSAWPKKSYDFFINMTKFDEQEFLQTSDTFRDPRVWWISNGEWWKDNIWGVPSSYGKVFLSKEEQIKYKHI